MALPDRSPGIGGDQTGEAPSPLPPSWDREELFRRAHIPSTGKDTHAPIEPGQAELKPVSASEPIISPTFKPTRWNETDIYFELFPPARP